MAVPRRIVLGVCGGIAAYKSVYLLRLLKRAGSDVRVVMTPSAREFVGPVTFGALSGHEVLADMIGPNGKWNNHVDLARWADEIVIAPATANTMAHLAHGICDNMLLAVCLSARCPVTLAPAMDLDMWSHPTTRDNTLRLKQMGYRILPVGEGALASGLEGEGRMLEPEQIVDAISKPIGSVKSGKRVRVLITAGPTYEPIDPVRFIGNRSSGKMGIALAEAFAKRNANVTLVLGPTLLSVPGGEIDVIRVETAEEMAKVALKRFPKADITIAAAAVADFKPKHVLKTKRKKEEGLSVVELEKTPDILQKMGNGKSSRQMLVGFALESDHELAHATKKLRAKNLDFIVMNSLKDPGAGFGHDTNKVTVIGSNNKVTKFELMSKTELAGRLADLILSKYA